MYRSLIGKLLYVVDTRPDICYAVHFLPRFIYKPSNQHLIAMKRMIKNLVGTAEYGLSFPREDSASL